MSTEDVSFTILSAQHIQWSKNQITTEGCPYSSLVLRINSPAILRFHGNILECGPSDLTYIPADHAYSAEYPVDGEIMYIHFTETTPFFGGIRTVTPLEQETIYGLFEQVVDLYSSKQQFYRTLAASVFLKIIVCLQQLNSKKCACSSFENAVRYLQENYQDPTLTINWLCDTAEISDTHLGKLFHEEFGMSPIRYLNELRIDYAQKLLYTNQCTVEQAALDSGFTDYRYFSRVVKKLRNCTPSMLRNR